MAVEGDERGRDTIERLRSKFSTWDAGHFVAFGEADFERYYPDRFAEQVQEILALTDRAEKRARKITLLDEVRSWIETNEDDAKNAFATSAGEVIEVLRRIEAELFSGAKSEVSEARARAEA
ncbi:MAG TPA: hypothetical protein VGB83_10530 [Actinomycetota bacterium]